MEIEDAYKLAVDNVKYYNKISNFSMATVWESILSELRVKLIMGD